MTVFQYHPEVLIRYPNLIGGVIYARDLHNGPTPGALLEAYHAEQRGTLERVGDQPLSEIASIAAWRRAFRAFGVKPTQYRSAAEALLRRLTKSGEVPSINLLTDLCNLVSIRYALPVAVFDLRATQGTITVRFANGTERFTPLGETVVEHPEPGEVIFTDETGLVIARRWCWRQSDESAVHADAAEAVITVEAQHPGARPQVEAAVQDLLALLRQYAGGQAIAAILDPKNPGMET